jgi:hydroxymethylpyrimidine/phosphomethylpyrimidine kinase
MYNCEQTVPVVMSFSASDPSGGAGIQADIEALGAMGCHCAPVITAITARDTTSMFHFYPTSSRLVRDQARAVLEDMPVAVFKIGMLGSIENVRALHQILKDYPDVPLVLDPVLQIGPTGRPMDPGMLEAMVALILPRVSLCTLNVAEARLMAPEADTIDACAQEIMAHGADYVLITGNLQNANKITNTLYGNYRRLECSQWDRLENNFQGAGCTLSACIAGLMAQGLPPPSAAYQGQEFVTECLKQGYRIGMGSSLPNRYYWAREVSYEYDVRKKIN